MIAHWQESVSRLRAVVDRCSPRCWIACSGGIDSLLLATLAHRWAADQTVVVHAIGPAVPEAATEGALLSGTNRDDLHEYRPGLRAAAEAGVVHPFVEAGIGKEEIRRIARALDLPFAELPAPLSGQPVLHRHPGGGGSRRDRPAGAGGSREVSPPRRKRGKWPMPSIASLPG
jgi:PP-loop superfamily ATP-utilizing enzyme